MPVRSSVTQDSPTVWRGTVDARWTMSYATGLRRSDDQYLDTEAPDGVVAHPMFPVAPEWQLITDPTSQIDLGLSPEERARGVHASHDVTIHRPIRAGREVTVTASVIGVQRTRAGAFVTTQLDGACPEGPLWSTRMGSMYRGVEMDGDEVVPVAVPLPTDHPEPTGDPVASDRLELWRGEAHVYTECARIWNPIHTDIAFARAAALPDIILHGTATLAHGTSFALDTLGVGAAAARRVGGSFRSMVRLPSTIELRILRVDELSGGQRIAHFDVLTEDGEPAVRDGYVVVDTEV